MSKENLAALAKTFVFKKLPDSEVELSGDIPTDTIAPYRETALMHLAEHVEMPGFRPGHVPADIVLKKVGEIAVLEEAVELFMQDFYIPLLEEHKVDAVGRPDIRITKLAPGNPVSVVINAAIYPVVTLPKDWKAIGEKVAHEPAAPATDEEVAQTIEQLRKSRAQKPTPTEGAEQTDVEPVLPELDDAFAKSLGAFENVESLKTQIKKGIGEEKERAAKDTRRGKIIEALLEKVEVEIPAIFVESELDKIMSQMKEDVARFNIPFEDYLKRIEKTEEQMREEFRKQARQRAKLQLTLNKIAEDEKVEADKAEVDEEVKHAFEHFPEAKPELVRIHVETVLKNEKVLQMLRKIRPLKGVFDLYCQMC
jgi:FKBP-type peptidyl-prolyl cis-trans isomerase (trigger factor)